MRRQYTYITAVALFLLAMLTACAGPAPLAQPAAEAPGQADVVVPLREDQPTTVETGASTGSLYYAANPELMVVHRYIWAIEQRAVQPESYDIEAVRAQNYAAFAAEQSDSTYRAANPELNAASRYKSTLIEESTTGSAFYAANPELMAAQRCAVE